MALPKSKKKGEAPKPETVEVEPDAWERFEHAVKQVAKARPQHRVASTKPKKRKVKTE